MQKIKLIRSEGFVTGIRDDSIFRFKIINNAVLTLAGNCNASKVNSAGSYLNNPGEYTFIVDYKITPAAGIPSFPLSPGRYSANIKFCLSEM